VTEGFYFFNLHDPTRAPRFIALSGRSGGHSSWGTWNQDGTLFAAVRLDRTAVIIDPATGEGTRLDSTEPPVRYPPTWTADGSAVLTGAAAPQCLTTEDAESRRFAVVPIDGGPERPEVPDLADGLNKVRSGGIWALDNHCASTVPVYDDSIANVLVVQSSHAETWVTAEDVAPAVLRQSVLSSSHDGLWVLTTEDGPSARGALYDVRSPHAARVVSTFAIEPESPGSAWIIGAAPDDSTVAVMVGWTGSTANVRLVPTDGTPATTLGRLFAGFVPRSLVQELGS
jgi:hypothetical protein